MLSAVLVLHEFSALAVAGIAPPSQVPDFGIPIKTARSVAFENAPPTRYRFGIGHTYLLSEDGASMYRWFRSELPREYLVMLLPWHDPIDSKSEVPIKVVEVRGRSTIILTERQWSYLQWQTPSAQSMRISASAAPIYSPGHGMVEVLTRTRSSELAIKNVQMVSTITILNLQSLKAAKSQRIARGTVIEMAIRDRLTARYAMRVQGRRNWSLTGPNSRSTDLPILGSEDLMGIDVSEGVAVALGRDRRIIRFFSLKNSRPWESSPQVTSEAELVNVCLVPGGRVLACYSLPQPSTIPTGSYQTGGATSSEAGTYMIDFKTRRWKKLGDFVIRGASVSGQTLYVGDSWSVNPGWFIWPTW